MNYNNRQVFLNKLGEIQKVFVDMKSANKLTNDHMIELRKALNGFFKGAKCNIVYYSENNKLFYGMEVIPYIKDNDVEEILFSSNKKRINAYDIDIDSKLFDPMLNLSANELTAVILHEVGHLTNNTEPVEKLRKCVDSYLANNNTYIILSPAKQYKQILAFGIKDGLKRLTSLFNYNNNEEEILADEFVHYCGYGDYLESALKKINKNSFKLNKQIKNKLLVLQWCLRLYKNVKIQRIPALNTLKKSKDLTDSKLLRRELDLMVYNINRIDDDILISEGSILLKESIVDVAQNFSSHISDIYKNIKRKGLRSLSDDFYDLSIRTKNVDEEREALALLREINTRLSILDDYLKSEQLDPKTREKVFDIIDKYNDLRELLSKKQYPDKYYGLFVKTPVITSRFDL